MKLQNNLKLILKPSKMSLLLQVKTALPFLPSQTLISVLPHHQAHTVKE